MRYFIIAGEASGDLHASNLVCQIRALDPRAEFEGFGGERMMDAGVKLHRHYKEIAFMGFVEVIIHLPTILGAIKQCKKVIQNFDPAVLVLVDYPGFNLRIAEWAHNTLQTTRIHYYISPQVWAWKANRAYKIKNFTHRLYCILPFEPDFFKRYELETEYVGHPLLDEIKGFKPNHTVLSELSIYPDDQVMALLPGSRKQEINNQLPIMLEAASQFPRYKKVVAGAPGVDRGYYDHFLESYNDVHLLCGETYTLLSCADRALITSGTATLEAALFKVPQVVCYKGSKLSYEIAKRLVHLDYISLVNLILDKAAVCELIQERMNVAQVVQAIEALEDDAVLQQLQEDYTHLINALNKEGASENVAEAIWRDAKEHVPDTV